jgi:uncharacterized membrane protein (DUF4010 family)
MTMDRDLVLALAIGSLCGAAVGAERQWSGHADGDDAHFGGLRTFTLLGLLGGVAGWLWTHDGRIVAAVLLTGAVALVAVAYAAASRRDIDGTTEVAALVVLAAGVLAGIGLQQVASAITALMVLLLAEKTRLHGLVRLIDDEGFRAGVRFAVMALVILPLLPEGPIDPWGGIRPRALWMLVLLFSGLSFAGFVARAVVGERYGAAITGLLGGIVSSTLVTLTFSRLSRERPDEGRALAAGVLAACTVLFPRVAIAVAVVHPPLLTDLMPLLVAPLLVGAAASLVAAWRRTDGEAPTARPKNPLRIGAALQMALLFQVVWFVVEYAERWFGQSGLTGTAIVTGLTDVDALTASIAGRVAQGDPAAAGAVAIAIGISSNTVLKLGIATLVGRGAFRIGAGIGLLAMLAAAVLSILFLR